MYVRVETLYVTRQMVMGSAGSKQSRASHGIIEVRVLMHRGNGMSTTMTRDSGQGWMETIKREGYRYSKYGKRNNDWYIQTEGMQ